MQFDISLGMAFLAGVASFLSPCVFALVPAYITYLGGRSAGTVAGDQQNAQPTFIHGLFFVLGFTTVFVLLGTVFASLGGLVYNLTTWLVRIGGIIIIVFGLNMLGVLKITWLEYDLRPKSIPDRKCGFISSFLMGLFFSAGWSPCVGPVLGMILTLALFDGQMLHGIVLLLLYSLGLGIPFLIAAMQIGWVISLLRNHGRLMMIIQKVMAVLMIGVGIMLFFNKIAWFSSLGAAALDTEQEVTAGLTILGGILGSLVIGLVPAYYVKHKGKNFTEWWFLSTGVLLIIAVLLYTFIIP